jgi:hypothetical protein
MFYRVQKELAASHKNMSFYKSEAERMQSSQLGFIQKSERIMELEAQLFRLEQQVQILNE